MARGAVKLASTGGKFHSAKSKTGDPKCSAAMSEWVRGRKTGNVGAAVFAVLAKCRSKARQNRKAQLAHESGKLAEGRGTWQRSERAAQLAGARAQARPAPVSPSPAAKPSLVKPRAALDERAARVRAKATARVQASEVAKRRDLHDGKGGLNTSATPEQKAAIARHNRTIERSGRALDRVAEARRSAAKGSPSDLVARARTLLGHAQGVHAANPGPAMTTHNPVATNAKPAPGGFSLAGGSGRSHNNGASAFHDTGKGHGGRAPLFGLDDLPTGSARGQGSLFGGRMKDDNAGTSGTTGRTVVVGPDGKHRLPGDFSKTSASLARAPMPTPAPTSSGKAESREGRLASIVGKLRAKVKAKPADPSHHDDHEPGYVGMLDTGLIHADPHRFQFKIGHGEGGIVGSLDGVTHFDHNLAGVVQVWRDPANNKTNVVNGHNRLHKAKQLGADQITVRYIKAKDAEEARSIGALTNIAEGRGTALDAGKFFRDTGLTREAIAAKGIPLREKVAVDGLALAKLDKGVFDRVVSGDLSQERGAIIGGSGLDHPQQRALLAMVDAAQAKKGGEVNNAHLREFADTARSAASVKHETRDLFGSSSEDVSLALHKSKLQAVIKEKLGKEKRLFGIVAKSKHAEDLARAGNVIDSKASGQISHEAAITLDVFDRMKNLSGPVSRHLNQAAERIHNGDKSSRAFRKCSPEAMSSAIDELSWMQITGNLRYASDPRPAPKKPPGK